MKEHGGRPAPESAQRTDVRKETQSEIHGVFRAKEDLAAYRRWRRDAPSGFREIVEGHLRGAPVRRDAAATPLVGQFLDGVQALLAEPDGDVDAEPLDARVQRQLRKVQRVAVGERETVNLFALLADPEVGFATKYAFYESDIRSRLAWLAGKDHSDLEEYREEETAELPIQPPTENDSYTPHRGPEGEGGEPGAAIALVYPFFGGRYADGYFDAYDPSTLTWSKSPRAWGALPPQRIDAERRRVYRAAASHSARTTICLPRGWGIEQKEKKFLADQDGISSLETVGGAEKILELAIGPAADAIAMRPPEGAPVSVPDRFPHELLAAADGIMRERKQPIAKARMMARMVRNHLAYNKDPQLEAVYKADTAAYFEKIWEHKQAKCDEANTLAARLLTRYGFHVKFASGHSVREKSDRGEAVLADSNRHAWMTVWDDEARAWVWLDATPKGDPNVDEEEQEEMLEGEHGEEDAELMDEEELEKRLKEMEHAEVKTESPETAFAKEAECAPEEARRVLGLIERLRKKYQRVLEEAATYWRTVVRRNEKERVAYRGPVPRSIGDELEEPVETRMDIRAGVLDPGGFSREKREVRQEKLFGGYEVYLAADMSGSMDETVGGVKKSDAMRDMAFLLADSIMSQAAVARQKQRGLKAPMPVKVCVAAFGATTEIVLPVTDRWGPAEQIRLYRALDRGAGGGTPDHAALAMIEREIANAKAAEEKEKKRMNAKNAVRWAMHRFVVAVADGGSNSPGAVKAVNDRLADAGIPVDLFLIASEDDENLLAAANSAYPSVSVVPDPKKLAERGLTTLTKRIKETFGV